MIATLLVAVVALFISVCFGAALEPYSGLGGLNHH